MDLLPVYYSSIIDNALAEDIGGLGDVTSMSVIGNDVQGRAVMRSRVDGVVSGIDVAEEVFLKCDKNLKVEKIVDDGYKIDAGDDLMIITGDARSILLAERVALNLISHMSGIATATNKLVCEIVGTDAKVTCTRKTTPGLRVLEKYAVRSGGGYNHRYGLYDAALIKDNHIAVAGSILNAVELAKSSIGHMCRVEVEVDNLEQLAELMKLDVDVVMLDNMPNDMLREAVQIVAGKFITEASGGVNLGNIRSIAETDVDYISCGWITHSSPILDIGLDM